MLLYTDPSGIVSKPERLPGHVLVVCGNSADMQMAYEATVGLNMMGAYATMLPGISAAELRSLASMRDQLTAADALVVCCAEQPALAGLMASLVDVPVIALPGIGRPDPTMAMCVPGTEMPTLAEPSLNRNLSLPRIPKPLHRWVPCMPPACLHGATVCTYEDALPAIINDHKRCRSNRSISFGT